MATLSKPGAFVEKDSFVQGVGFWGGELGTTAYSALLAFLEVHHLGP
jgi:hypothetical protein